ncbi:MAG: hypothetical protein RPR40_04860, partial [Bermanella sp.]
FANGLLDQALAVITAGALVAFSYIFVPMIIRLFEFKRWAMLCAVVVLELVLVLSSLAATIGWLESNYQNNYQKDVTGSDAYLHQQTQINNLTTRINELTALATLDRKNNYRQRAMRLLSKADRLSDERQLLIKHPIKHTTGNSGTTLANDLGSIRYALWALMALLVDGCPMACFAILSGSGTRPIKTTLPSTNKPDHPVTLMAEVTGTDDNDTLYQEIASDLKAGRWGDKPAMRNVILDKKIRHTLAKEYFARYLVDGILTQNGSRFERVA